jgi:mRNA interferase YafQ
LKLRIRRTNQFKKDLKRMLKRGKEIEDLLFVVSELVEQRELDDKFRDHALTGQYKNKRDCHIEPDWLLLYAIEDDELILYRTGTHSDLFT